MTMPQQSYALSIDEVKQFHEQGFLGPFTAFSEDEMADIRDYIEREVLDHDDGPQEGAPVHDRHRDHSVIYDLYTHPAIVDRMKSIYGDDLLLWATHLWNKQPGDAEIPWHQDGSYWDIEPPLNISAWIAIDEVTTENACVNLIPRSHQQQIPHVDAPESVAFGEMADPGAFDPDGAVEMELRPGQFFLFTERTLHQSDPNDSDRRRLGTSMRVTLPIVDIDHESLYPGHEAAVISGEDWHGINATEDLST
jgi:ectoine hydroxylase-related dioxygenase (phytanoyl-CoA dioxygenase family)